MAGGTGLYAQALVDGFDLSPVKPDKTLREKLETKTLAQLFSRLTRLDKKFADNLNESEKNNKRRLIRYIEIKSQKSNVKGQMSTVRTEELEVFLKLLAPFAPHVTEELWQMIRSSVLGRRFSDSGQSIGQSVSGAATKNKPGLEEPYKPGLEAEKERPKIDNWSIHSQPWPRFDPKLAASKQVTLVVQINGKVRDRLPVEAGVSKDEVEKLALASERVQKYLGNRKPQRVVFVADRLINLVI